MIACTLTTLSTASSAFFAHVKDKTASGCVRVISSWGSIGSCATTFSPLILTRSMQDTNQSVVFVFVLSTLSIDLVKDQDTYSIGEVRLRVHIINLYITQQPCSKVEQVCSDAFSPHTKKYKWFTRIASR